MTQYYRWTDKSAPISYYKIEIARKAREKIPDQFTEQDVTDAFLAVIKEYFSEMPFYKNVSDEDRNIISKKCGDMLIRSLFEHGSIEKVAMQ